MSAPISDSSPPITAPSVVSEAPNQGTTLWKALRDPRNADTKRSCFTATFFMATIPLSVFFVCQRVIFRSTYYGGSYSQDTSLTYSGIAAVIAVNLVMVGFTLWSALLDPNRNDYDEELLVTPEEARARAKAAAAIDAAAAAAAAKRRRELGVRRAAAEEAGMPPGPTGVTGMLYRLAAALGNAGPTAVASGGGKVKKGRTEDAGGHVTAAKGKKKGKVAKASVSADAPAAAAGGKSNDGDDDEEEEEEGTVGGPDAQLRARSAK